MSPVAKRETEERALSLFEMLGEVGCGPLAPRIVRSAGQSNGAVTKKIKRELKRVEGEAEAARRERAARAEALSPPEPTHP